MQLGEAAFEFSARLKPGLYFGPGPYGGQRLFAEIIEGRVWGTRLRGRVSSGGGDWLQVGTNGFGVIDARAHIVTHDDAAILLVYTGYLEMNAAVRAAIGRARDTTFTDQYFRTAIRMETGDDRYEWVNRSLFIGEGKLFVDDPGLGVSYRVYQVP